MAFNYEQYTPFHDWHESVTDDAKAIAALMGWRIDNVYFSGFWSQGDGACFTGFLGYAKGCAKAVKEYAPLDTQLHSIAQRWQDLQRRYFYGIESNVKHSGRYSHEYCTEFSTEIRRPCDRYSQEWHSDFPADLSDDVKDIARDFMRWIYRQLEKEYEYQSALALAEGWQEQRVMMEQTRKDARQLVRDMREAIKSGINAAPSICQALRGALRSKLEEWEAARDERDEIADHFSYWEDGKRMDISEFSRLNF